MYLGQFKIIKNRRIAEHHQNGATILRRMWTVRSHRLDIEFRAHRIGDALVDEISAETGVLDLLLVEGEMHEKSWPSGPS